MIETAYSTDNPEVVAAYRNARDAEIDYGRRLNGDLDTLGVSREVFINRGLFGTRNELVALQQKGDHIPDGWRVVRGRLEPRRGKAGEPARQWLAERQPPDIRHVMTDHGLPRHSRLPAGNGFSFRMVTPALFEHEGTLWACYEGEPGDGFGEDEPCTWTPRKLSEFHAAKEAAEAAQSSAAVEATR